MIITRHRTHQVNMTNYESVKFGASVTLDLDEDDISGEITEGLNRALDELLQEDMDEALSNVPADEPTHVETWRKPAVQSRKRRH